MKRILIVVAIAACLLPVTMMGSLNITSPTSSSYWQIWSYHDITWTWTGDQPDSFVIEWMENKYPCYYWIPVATVTESTSSYNWRVGCCIEHVPNCPYPAAKIKIRVFDGGSLIDFDESDTFYIYN